MRCDEVIRELAVPTDDRDRTVLDAHLADCPSCVAWARRATLLDQLWEATRPCEPAPEAWDSVWANITQSLQSATAEREFAATAPSSLRLGASPKIITHSVPAPTQPSNRAHARRFAAIVLMGLAQAAAILVALGLAWRVERPSQTPRNPQIAQNNTPSPPRVPSVIRVSQPVMFEVDIEEGHLMKFCVDGPAPRVEDVTPQMAFGIRDGTPGDMMMFNVVESFARTMVASQ
jgi:hypothetical protein